jgi:hypothetical protein
MVLMELGISKNNSYDSRLENSQAGFMVLGLIPLQIKGSSFF